MGCPLAKRFEVPVDEISEEAAKKTIEQRIRSFGMWHGTTEGDV